MENIEMKKRLIARLNRSVDLENAMVKYIRFEMIEKASSRKAAEMGMSDEEYYEMVFTQNNGSHFK